MRHLVDKLKIPAVMQNVLEYIDKDTENYLDPYERVYSATNGLLYDLSNAVLLSYFNAKNSDEELTSELFYNDTPFEIVPFSYNGGDALNYSWVNLAPELDLDDYPCISFAPGEDGAVWLGNDTNQALSNLLVGYLKGWEKWKKKGNSPVSTKQWKSLVEIIGVEPTSKNNVIAAGARSNLKIFPNVPKHWKYEIASDGVGVLAMDVFFADNFTPPPKFSNFDLYINKTEEYLKQNKPATSLLILKQARKEIYDNSEIMQLIKLFKKSYELLDRGAHVKRVEIWLEKNEKNLKK